MPSYYYHIKLEVYPTSSPTSQETGRASESRDGSLWLPGKTSNIFDNLPSHHRTQRALAIRHGKARHHWQQTPNPLSQTKANPSVIDCGAPRPPEAQDDRTIVRISERQLRQRTHSFPPPQSYIAINPRTAAKDWRFGQLRIESIDVGDYEEEHEHHGDMQATSAAAAAVGPAMGGAGRATKAKFVPSTNFKNTELGWGIVHLYREESESPELAIPPDQTSGTEEEQQDGAQNDCTTVCIPAVPSYLSPGDFLGFVGDKWRDQVSHYRMVMTGRMNRYLVLMKFRESKQAQLFRREFDGKVFNDVEVRFSLLEYKWI